MLRSDPSDVRQDTRVMPGQNCGLNKGRWGRRFGGIKKRRISWLPRAEFIIRVTVQARGEKIRRYSVSISQPYLHVTWMADRILMPPFVRTEIKRLGREKILFKLATRGKSVREKEVCPVSSRATFSSSHTANWITFQWNRESSKRQTWELFPGKFENSENSEGEGYFLMESWNSQYGESETYFSAKLKILKITRVRTGF